MHLLALAGAVPVPYPSWLNTGDNTWQVAAATFVALQSIPGLAVLYAAVVPKKWAVNVMSMMFWASRWSSWPGCCGATRWASVLPRLEMA